LIVVQRSDDLIGIDDLYLVGPAHICGGDDARPRRVQLRLERLVGKAAQAQLLDVQHDLRDVLFDVGDAGKLVMHTVDADGADGGTRKRGQQHPPHRVADSVAVSPVQRLDGELAVVRVDVGTLLGFNAADSWQVGWFDHRVLPSSTFSTQPLAAQ
jgi:hypothetical protein